MIASFFNCDFVRMSWLFGWQAINQLGGQCQNRLEIVSPMLKHGGAITTLWVNMRHRGAGEPVPATEVDNIVP